MTVVNVMGRAEVIMNNRDLANLVRRNMGDDVGDVIDLVVREFEMLKEVEEERIDGETRELYSVYDAIEEVLNETFDLKMGLEDINKNMNRARLLVGVNKIESILRRER